MAFHPVVDSTSDSSFSSAAAPDLMQPALDEKPAAPVVERARCNQCRKTLRHMALFPGNITCQQCYGAERYQRGPGVPIGPSSLTAPIRDNTYNA